MTKHLLGVALTLAAVLLATSSVAAQGQSEVVGVWGEVPGRDLVVHAWVVVEAGADRAEVAREALAHQGARPIQSAPFSETGLQWPQFTDGDATNDFVVQNYNPADQPDGVTGAILQATQATWSGVGSSFFALSYGGETGRCPSLVRECQGPQYTDGNQDVAWMELRGCCTLGVTWFTTSGDPEADVALNLDFGWATDGIDDFDVETVLLHENGHVAGLGHSDVVGAVMEAIYAGARRQLHQDDIDGITALYPNVATGTIAGTVTDAGDASAIAGASVSTGTGQATTTAADGSYTLTDVPTGGSTVTASADGYGSDSQTTTVVENATSTVNFALAAVPTGSIAGTVTDDAAAPNAISGATVSTGTGQSTTTAGDGSYTLSGVPTGGSTVTVTADGYAGDSATTTVNENETSTVNFALTEQTVATSVSVSSFAYSGDGGKNKDKHVSVTIALVDNLGGAAGGASISVRMDSNSGASATGSGTTGSDGTITFTWSNAPGDCYTTTVTSVTSGDLTFDTTGSTSAEACKPF